MTDEHRFKDKVVVITGGGQGLGAGFAQHIVREGGKVALLDLHEDKLKDQVNKLGSDNAAYWVADVTDAQELTRVAQGVKKQYGIVDIVIVNAGIGTGELLEASEADKWNAVIQVNLIGSANTFRAFIPLVKESRGYLVQISSLAALAHPPYMSAYNATKAGVEALADSVRAELAAYGVAVGIAYLSWTKTPMVEGADKNPALKEARESAPGVLAKTYPVDQIVGHIINGIAERKTHIYGNWWIPIIRYGARPFLPYFIAKYSSGKHYRPAADFENKSSHSHK